MSDARFADADIVEAWRANASSWTDAVRAGRIESRRRVTDAAVVDAVLEGAPATVLDIGCGEGWLSRRLAREEIRVCGIDAVPALIEAAIAADGNGDYRVMAHESVAAERFDTAFDVIVFNFSLLGESSVEHVLAAGPSLLSARGRVLIQTLHPAFAAPDADYRDGWRPESDSDCNGICPAPAPWYFRTLAGWTRLLADSGLALSGIREPLHPDTRRPASILFEVRPARRTGG